MSDISSPGEAGSPEPTSSVPPTKSLGGPPPSNLADSQGPVLPGGLPKKLGAYLLKDELGRGGMGVVYKAWDEHLDRPAAIKVLSPVLKSMPEALERLKTEARAAARLNHPNIVSVYAFGEDEGWSWIAMEFVEGRDLGKMIKAVGSIDPARAVRYVREAAEALEYAAQHKVIHRDIKPSNIFIGNDDRARVMDFGLAKRMDMESGLTATGSTLGTPDYMSPEQALSKSLDHRTDIYSLGCTLFSLLSGKRPYGGSSVMEVIMQHVQKPLEVPKDWNRIAGGRLTDALDRMTRKDQDERFQTWAEVAAAFRDIETALKGGVPVQPVRRTRDKNAVTLIVGAVGVVAVVAVGLVFWGSRGSGGRSSTSAAAAWPTLTPAPETQSTPPPAATPARVVPETVSSGLVRREDLVRALYEGRWDDARKMAPQLDSNTVAPGTPGVPPLAVLRQDLAIAAGQAARIEGSLFNRPDTASLTPEEKNRIVVERLQERGTEMEFAEAWASVLFLTLNRHSSAPELASYLQDKFPQGPGTRKNLAVLHGVGIFMSPGEVKRWDNIRPQPPESLQGGPSGQRSQFPSPLRRPHGNTGTQRQ